MKEYTRPTLGSGTMLLIPLARSARGMLAWAAGLLSVAVYGVHNQSATTVLGRAQEAAEGAILLALIAGAAWLALGLIGVAAEPAVARLFELRMRKASWDNTLPALWDVTRIREEATSKSGLHADYRLVPSDGAIVAYIAQMFAKHADMRLIKIIEQRSAELGMTGGDLSRARLWSATARSMAWATDNLPNPLEQPEWSQYLGLVGDSVWVERGIITEKVVREVVAPALPLHRLQLVQVTKLLYRASYSDKGLKAAQQWALRKTMRSKLPELCLAVGELSSKDMESVLKIADRLELRVEEAVGLASRLAMLPAAQRSVVSALADTWVGDAESILQVASVLE